MNEPSVLIALIGAISTVSLAIIGILAAIINAKLQTASTDRKRSENKIDEIHTMAVTAAGTALGTAAGKLEE